MAIWRDITYAVRQVRRQPLFALVIVLMLGSAMGVNTSLFSMFNATMLRPWPVKDAGRLVVVHYSQLSSAEWN